MAARTKLTREPPVRTGPIRRPARALWAVNGTAKAVNGTMNDVVERSVDTAYMVIDEYMERGRAAARLQTERTDGRDEMSTDDPLYTNPFGVTSELMAPWVQLMRMWANGVASLVPGGSSAVNTWMNAFTPAGMAWAGMTMDTKVAVRVKSIQEVAVTVDLTPGAGALKLRAERVGQKGKSASAPKVDADLVSTAPGLVTVTVTVPDGQPKGLVSFTIRDSSNQPRGTMQVNVLPDP
jgi:hypothetical protein